MNGVELRQSEARKGVYIIDAEEEIKGEKVKGRVSTEGEIERGNGEKGATYFLLSLSVSSPYTTLGRGRKTQKRVTERRGRDGSVSLGRFLCLVFFLKGNYYE